MSNMDKLVKQWGSDIVENDWYDLDNDRSTNAAEFNMVQQNSGAIEYRLEDSHTEKMAVETANLVEDEKDARAKLHYLSESIDIAVDAALEHAEEGDLVGVTGENEDVLEAGVYKENDRMHTGSEDISRAAKSYVEEVFREEYDGNLSQGQLI